MLSKTARKKIYGTALRGIYPCLFVMKSIFKLIYVNILAEICNECVSALDVFRNILKQTINLINCFMKTLSIISKKVYLK